MERTKAHYEHYAKCQSKIQDCIICRFVWGNLTQEEQHKYRKILRNNIQTLAIYKETEQ